MPILDIPLPEDGTGSASWWKSRVQLAIDRRRELAENQWKRNIAAYKNEVPTRRPGDTRVAIEYEKTEQKKWQLMFQLPRVVLQPRPGSNPPTRDAVRVFQRVINFMAGEDGLNLKSIIEENIFDVLCPSGIGACVIGYEVLDQGTNTVQVGEEPDPDFYQPGSILSLGPAPMRPVYEEVPNVVSERYFVDRVSPVDLIVPNDFRGSDFDKADYLGYDFDMPVAEAINRGWVAEDYTPSYRREDADRVSLSDSSDGSVVRGSIHGRRIFYYASRVDPQIAHPQRIRELVLVDGEPDPVIHRDLRYQVWSDNGHLIAGIKGYPVKVLTTRYISDDPIPMSDCSASCRQVDELSDGRSQMIRHRRTAHPMRWVNVRAMVDEAQVERIKRGETGDIIALDQPGDEVLGEVARAQYPRENFTFNDYIHADIDRMWAMGSNQSGIREQTARTATELSLIQRATDTRLSGEQGRVTAYFIRIVRTLATLVQMFHDDTDYVDIVGPDGVAQMVPWDKDSVAGEYLFSIVPDSSRRPDISSERELGMQRYNLLAKDPHINHKELVRQTLELFGGDPELLIVDPTPPQPEEPKVSISIKGEDLNPASPQYSNVITLLKLKGLSGQPPAGRESPMSELGPADVVDRDSLEQGSPDGRLGGAVDIGSIQ